MADLIAFQGEVLCTSAAPVVLMAANSSRHGFLLQHDSPYSYRVTLDDTTPTATHGVLWRPGIPWTTALGALNTESKDPALEYLVDNVRILLLPLNRSVDSALVGFTYFQSSA